jgi:hypothetical protein
VAPVFRASSVLRAVGAVLLASGAGAAEPPAEPVRASVEYAAPAECAGREKLIDHVRRRSERIQIAEMSERRLRVEIAREPDGFVASLELEQPSGRRSSRTLRAKTCDEAIEAAALVAALSLDPLASTAPEAELPPPVATPLPETPRPEPSVRPEPPAEAPSRAPRSFYGSVALAGQGTWGPAPALLPGIGLSLLGGLESSSVFAPVLRLSYVHFGRAGFRAEQGVGEASFQLDVGTLDACPLRLGTRVAALLPCASASGGRLLVQGSDALEAERHSRPWWVLGGSLIGLLHPLPALELTLSAGVGIPLIQDTFVFAPEEPGHLVHEVPGAAVTIGLGAGLVFR